MTITERMKYMKEYRRVYANRKRMTTSEMFFEERFNASHLKIEPSFFQFKGTDELEPVVCSHFGCSRHLTHEEKLYGTKCIHHQNPKKQDAGKFISH